MKNLAETLSDRELATVAAIQAGVPARVAETVVDAYLAAMAQTLAHGRTVRVRCVGTLHVVPRRKGFAGSRIRFVANDRLRRAMALPVRTPAGDALVARIQRARLAQLTRRGGGVASAMPAPAVR